MSLILAKMSKIIDSSSLLEFQHDDKNDSNHTFFNMKHYPNYPFSLGLQSVRFINCIKHICTSLMAIMLTLFFQAMSAQTSSSGGSLTCCMLLSCRLSVHLPHPCPNPRITAFKEMLIETLQAKPAVICSGNIIT